jgi:hypothetical protein
MALMRTHEIGLAAFCAERTAALQGFYQEIRR